ncbi:MAG: NUDIX domain-containing protein [Lachnospiraceae bacterium]|nr:NUDIX domain-containing protein [Lachnospiraceae bacterium]
MSEILDIVDEHGNPTGQTVEREKAHTQGIMHRTSHVWIVRKKEEKIQVLLQKRSINKESFPGCFDISSAGHIPAGCGYVESALRELSEELGVHAYEEDLIFCGDRLVLWDDKFNGKVFCDRQYSRVFALWLSQDEKDFILQPEEVDAVLWMDLEQCMEAVKQNTISHCMVLEELEMVYAAVNDEEDASIS